MKKKLPIGIQSIGKILTHQEYAYVDKTGYALQLIEEGIPHYFMSRPRRFGKSLFLSTLEEIFQGNKELFQDCQIYDSSYNWEKYPVLSFDFSRIASRSPEEFEASLKRNLQNLASINKISLETPTIQEGLESLIIQLASKNNQVVVLVDEYDSPIINNLKNLEIAGKNRDLLKYFFGVLKSLDKYLKFSFVTGVSKFSQVSLFSGPNNLTDITMDSKYASMMGYTEEEIIKSFSSYLEEIAKKGSIKQEVILKEMREWYNGYRFSEDPISVYNPYSTLRFLSARRAESYWYSTGTPSFLIDEVKKHPKSVAVISGTSALKSTLSDISKLDQIHLAALMFQTGYLTIRAYNQKEDSYQLDFPNREVRQAFFNSLLQEFTEVDPLEVSRTSEQLKKELETYDLQSFVITMNRHFAKIPYHLFKNAREGFYQAVFFTFLEKSGITVHAEVPTNIGRIDLVFEMPRVIFIFELKVDQTAESALSQAEIKKYNERYANNGKEILVMGINFSSQSRNIGEWKAALYSMSGERVREIGSL